MGFDEPFDPAYLEDLIRILGAKSMSYSEHHSCCAGGLSIARSNDVAPSAKRILSSARNSGAEAMVVNCPFCFAQLVRSQSEISEYYADKVHVPVFYITELMGLAFGASEKDLGLPLHYDISIDGESEFVREILKEKTLQTLYDEDITKIQLELCAGCLACADDCQTAMTTSEYNPQEILELVLEGNVDEAIKRDDIWYCMNCHECTTQCPQDFGMVKLIVKLKNLAVEAGIYPEVVGHRASELHKGGYSFPPDFEKRKDLGLGEISMPDMDNLKKLMKKVKAEEKNEGD
jgi:heterodisulfide reductase subunit C